MVRNESLGEAEEQHQEDEVANGAMLRIWL